MAMGNRFFYNNPFGRTPRVSIKENYLPYMEKKIDLIKYETKLLTELLPNLYEQLREKYGRD
jgi:hypothetical protein